MAKKIKRNIDGIVDYCLEQVEDIDAQTDMDPEKKAKIGLAYLKEVRGFVGANLAYKKLMATSPTVAKDPSIVMSVGTSRAAITSADD